jgi:xanthine dehydrogenase accessory factor
MRAATLRQILDDRAAARPVVLATNLKSGDEELLYPFEEIGNFELIPAAKMASRSDRSTTVDTDAGPIFLHVFNPPLRMILVGAVHISQPLSRMAALTGYQVAVVDPRRAFASEERFPGIELSSDWPDEAVERLAPDMRTAVIALTHDPKLDDPALTVALRSPAFYVGALGSKKTHASRKERLLAGGFSEEEFNRIRGPVGVKIGARSPAEIAVSVLAEVTRVLREADPA